MTESFEKMRLMRRLPLFYTLIESAKANDIDPHQYLSHVLKSIVTADTTEKLEALLPWNFK